MHDRWDFEHFTTLHIYDVWHKRVKMEVCVCRFPELMLSSYIIVACRLYIIRLKTILIARCFRPKVTVQIYIWLCLVCFVTCTHFIFILVCTLIHVNKYWNPHEEKRYFLNVFGFHDSFHTVTRQLKSGENIWWHFTVVPRIYKKSPLKIFCLCSRMLINNRRT